MDLKSRLALGAGVATCLGLVIMDRVAGRRKQLIIVEQDMPAPANKVLNVVKQVEREAELIPAIASVEVAERTENEVHYAVNATGCCPVIVRYHKWWDDSIPAAYWQSTCGTAGFHHEGSIHFTEKDGRSVAYLMSWHWITAPLIGRPITPMSTPFLRNQLETWLKNIANELEPGSD